MSVSINCNFKFQSRLRAEIRSGKITFPWPKWGTVSRLQMKFRKRKSTWGSTTMRWAHKLSFSRFGQLFIAENCWVNSSTRNGFWIEWMPHIAPLHRVDHSAIDLASVRWFGATQLGASWFENFWKAKSRQIDKRCTWGGLTARAESNGRGISGIQSVAAELWVEILLFPPPLSTEWSESSDSTCTRSTRTSSSLWSN